MFARLSTLREKKQKKESNWVVSVSVTSHTERDRQRLVDRGVN